MSMAINPADGGSNPVEDLKQNRRKKRTLFKKKRYYRSLKSKLGFKVTSDDIIQIPRSNTLLSNKRWALPLDAWGFILQTRHAITKEVVNTQIVPLMEGIGAVKGEDDKDDNCLQISGKGLPLIPYETAGEAMWGCIKDFMLLSPVLKMELQRFLHLTLTVENISSILRNPTFVQHSQLELFTSLNNLNLVNWVNRRMVTMTHWEVEKMKKKMNYFNKSKTDICSPSSLLPRKCLIDSTKISNITLADELELQKLWQRVLTLRSQQDEQPKHPSIPQGIYVIRSQCVLPPSPDVVFFNLYQTNLYFKQCNFCHKSESDLEKKEHVNNKEAKVLKLKLCQCQFIYYCNAICQKQDWDHHKLICTQKNDPKLKTLYKKLLYFLFSPGSATLLSNNLPSPYPRYENGSPDEEKKLQNKTSAVSTSPRYSMKGGEVFPLLPEEPAHRMASLLTIYKEMGLYLVQAEQSSS